MASKKYLLLAVVFCLLASYSFSQRVGASYDVKDSSVIPDKRMPQHTEFLNGTYNFPAKPRNQWEIGIKAGTFNISSDVPNKLGYGFGAHVRKAFGYIFSLRLEYIYGVGKGQHWLPAHNFGKNGSEATGTGWMSAGYFAPLRTTTGQIIFVDGNNNVSNTGSTVYYNYKAKVQDLSLQGVATLNNIRFHKAKTGFVLYGFAGLGGTVYETHINALNASSQPYNFSTVPVSTYETKENALDALDNMMDDSYETPAENQGTRRPKLFGKTFKPTGTVGAGLAFKLGTRINLAIEDRHTFTKDDLLDGQRWQEHAQGDAVLTRDFDSYNYASIGLNINLGARSVEPLWWLNPLDYAYSEIRNPRLMRLPKPVLPDSDGDGITDQFDQEQTPQGCPVDSHGVSKDTDGDGVPDCKDKELITPTYCQPVDADGVGKCPCDTTCVGRPLVTPCVEKLGALPSVSFSPNSRTLSNDAKAVLASVAARMRNNPECRVVVIGYCSSNKREQQMSWDHVNAVINYMVESEGISADRFIFNYGQEGGDCNTVDLRAAAEGEEGPNTVPAPHPNLRKNRP